MNTPSLLKNYKTYNTRIDTDIMTRIMILLRYYDTYYDRSH